MKKSILYALRTTAALLCACALLTGCSLITVDSKKGITYDVDTGDHINLDIHSGGGYKIESSDDPFTILDKDNEVVMFGTFAEEDLYDSFLKIVEEDEEAGLAQLLDQGKKDGNDYYFYTTETGGVNEYDYVVKVKDSKTCVVLGSLQSQDVAEDVFSYVEITVAK